MARAITFFLVCLFSLFSFSYADWGGAGDVMLYGFLAIAVALSAAFIGLAYMASQVFNVPTLGAWVKIEVQELVISAIIVVMLVAMTASINAAAQFVTSCEGGGDCAYQAAVGHLDDMRDNGVLLHTKLIRVGYLVNLAVGFSYSTSLSVFGIAGANWGQAPRAGLGGLVGAVGNAADSVALAMLFISAQKVFLVFFAAIASVIMPLGVVLRTFPLTRKLGALLLASGVATAVVYPAAIVLSGEIYDAYGAGLEGKIRSADAGVPNIGEPPGSDIMCNEWTQFFVSGFGLGEIGWQLAICIPICAGPQWAVCWPTCKWIVAISYYVASSGMGIYMDNASRSYIGTADAGKYFDAINEHALPAATEYITLMLVLSLIPLLFAVTLARNFASLFGGESQLYGLFKLVG